MGDRDTRIRTFELPTLPTAVQRITRNVAAAGHAVFVVGPCLRDLIAGVHPTHFDLSTNASLAAMTNLFPNSVLIDSRYQRVTIPTPAGPVDLTPFHAGPHIEDDLAHRDFTIHAMAYDANQTELLDPYGGHGDLADGLLRAVRCARDRFEEDPIRALRAVRLAATRDWKLDPELELALECTREALAKTPREPVRRELKAILHSPARWSETEESEHAQVVHGLVDFVGRKTQVLVAGAKPEPAVRPNIQPRSHHERDTVVFLLKVQPG